MGSRAYQHLLPHIFVIYAKKKLHLIALGQDYTCLLHLQTGIFNTYLDEILVHAVSNLIFNH